MMSSAGVVINLPRADSKPFMSKPANASSKGGITSHGMLSSHVFRRLLPSRNRPSPPSTSGASSARRLYPTSRHAITSHGIVTPVPDVQPAKLGGEVIETSNSTSKSKVVSLTPLKSPFYLRTGYATFAKRASRPFPPPFVSTPSTSFSDPLTTHSALRDRRPTVEGEFILGYTNGDDALLVTENYIVVNDGVGAWATKARGHAALWSRLIAHFWAMEVEKWKNGQDTTEEKAGQISADEKVSQPATVEETKDQQTTEEKELKDESTTRTDKSTDDKPPVIGKEDKSINSQEKIQQDDSPSAETVSPTAENATPAAESVSPAPENITQSAKETDDAELGPQPIKFLQSAFEKVETVTKTGNGILGTTTFVSALLHHRPKDLSSEDKGFDPLLYVTNVGDSAVLVIRPQNTKVIYHSKEQWHWFDCPRQLGTNSPDVPTENAVLDKVEVTEGDIVVAVSDGVLDNLWEHEVCEVICDSLRSWDQHKKEKPDTTKSKRFSYASRTKPAQKGHFNDHPVVELEGDDEDGMVFVARELVRCARVIAEDNFAESPFMERAVEEGLPFEGGKMDDITVAIGLVSRRKEVG